MVQFCSCCLINSPYNSEVTFALRTENRQSRSSGLVSVHCKRFEQCVTFLIALDSAMSQKCLRFQDSCTHRATLWSPLSPPVCQSYVYEDDGIVLFLLLNKQSYALPALLFRPLHITMNSYLFFIQSTAYPGVLGWYQCIAKVLHSVPAFLLHSIPQCPGTENIYIRYSKSCFENVTVSVSIILIVDWLFMEILTVPGFMFSPSYPVIFFISACMSVFWLYRRWYSFVPVAQ